MGLSPEEFKEFANGLDLNMVLRKQLNKCRNQLVIEKIKTALQITIPLLIKCDEFREALENDHPLISQFMNGEYNVQYNVLEMAESFENEDEVLELNNQLEAFLEEQRLIKEEKIQIALQTTISLLNECEYFRYTLEKNRPQFLNLMQSEYDVTQMMDSYQNEDEVLQLNGKLETFLKEQRLKKQKRGDINIDEITLDFVNKQEEYWGATINFGDHWSNWHVEQINANFQFDKKGVEVDWIF